jgi:hypothetical protein
MYPAGYAFRQVSDAPVGSRREASGLHLCGEGVSNDDGLPIRRRFTVRSHVGASSVFGRHRLSRNFRYSSISGSAAAAAGPAARTDQTRIGHRHLGSSSCVDGWPQTARRGVHEDRVHNKHVREKGCQACHRGRPGCDDS